MLKGKKLFVIITLIIFNNTLTFSQVDEYSIKAFLIWKILQYIEWPSSAQPDNSGNPFVITVLGENPFDKYLEFATENKTLFDKEIEIQYVENIQQTGEIDVLFITASKKSRIDELLFYLKDKPIILFGDSNGFGQQGVHINFFMERNKIKFELNETVLNDLGFKIDYRIRHIAKIVHDTGERR